MPKNQASKAGSRAIAQNPPAPLQDPLPAIQTEPQLVQETIIKEEKFTDLITAPADDLDDLYWFSDLQSGSPTAASPPEAEDSLLYGSIFGAIDAAALRVPVPKPEESVELKEEEDDALFAELDELPECAVVFRSSNFSFASVCGTIG
jgi:hypothetical protein